MTLRRPASSMPTPMALTLRLSAPLARLLVLALAVVLVFSVLLVVGDGLRTAEQRLGNMAWTLAPDNAVEERLTVVTIDEKSIAEIGPWPWPRATMAELSDALHRAGAQLQLYDVVFPEARSGDATLLDALERGNAVVGHTPVLEARQSLRAGTLTHAASGVDCSNLPSTSSFVASHGGFSSVPKGHLTPLVASDGGVRKVPALVCVDDNAYPALALSALLVGATGNTEGGESWQVAMRPGAGLLEAPQYLTLPDYPGLRVPLDHQGNMRISYERDPGSYRALSAVDVLNGDFDPAMLDNTWVLIGATAFGLGDIVPTPYSGAAPGVEVQARLIGSLLDNELPYQPRGAFWLQSLFVVMAAALLMGLAGFRERLALYGLPVATLLLPGLAYTLHAFLLTEAGLWLGWLVPSLFSIFAGSLLAILEHGRIRLEHDRVYTNLNSYLPAEVARQIAYKAPTSEVEAQRLDVTLLSADLRNFAAYTEARPPEETAALLHYFFTTASEVIERHGGRVQEFTGDGLLAVWDGEQEGCWQALQAGEALQNELHRNLLPAHAPAGLEPLGLGIGIERGAVLMGSIGPARRRTHALLGDTVTTVLRIQEMTAELALPILVGENAAAKLDGQRLQSQGRYLLSGLKVPHALYSPVMADSERLVRPAHGGPSLRVLSGGLQD